MALIKCTECGKEISDQANICPNCGYTVNNNVKTIKIKSNQLKTGSMISIISCSIIVILIAYIIAINIKLPTGYASSGEIVKIDNYTAICLLISLSLAPICLIIDTIFMLGKLSNIKLYKVVNIIFSVIQVITGLVSFVSIGCCGFIYIIFPILNFIGSIIVFTGKE